MSGVFAGLRSSRVSNSDVIRSEHSEAQSLLGGGGKKSGKAKAKREDYSDEESDLAIPLDRNAISSVPDQCVEAEVQPGDTLQSLSLKYNVPLAELKRVNKLLKESEFYALKRIKIPVKTASLLTEILPSVSGDRPNESGWYIQSHHLGVTSSSSTVQSSTPVSESETDLDGGVAVSHQLVDLEATSASSEPPHPKSKETKKANKFLKSIDKDISRIKASSSSLPEEDDDDEGYSLTTINGDGKCMTTKLAMPSRRRHPYDASWCSKQGLVCAFVIFLSVMAILGLAYWLNLHESWFERPVPTTKPDQTG